MAAGVSVARCAVVFVALAIGSTFASAQARASCGTSISMESVAAVVTEYPLGPARDWRPALTLDDDGFTPLVASDVSVGEARVAAVATIDARGYEIHWAVPYQLLATGLVPVRDAFLSVMDGHYVSVSRSTYSTLALSDPILAGFHVQAIGADATGHRWAVESRAIAAQRYENILIDLESQHRFSLASSGFVVRLIRGADGKEYVKTVGGSPKQDELIRADTRGPHLLPGTSLLTSDDDIAIAADGTVWRAGMLGVRHIDENGNGTESVGPIAPVPCMISNTAALTTREPRIAPDGTIWFTYLRSIFHVDRQRRVTRLDLPPDLETPSQLTIARGGIVWFVARRDQIEELVKLPPKIVPEGAL